jgi:hypothetical protein
MRPINAGIAKGPRKVLVVGMLDSVHFARWLLQFKDEEIDFSIFAAKKYRNLSPLLVSLLNSNERASFNLVSNRHYERLSGYLDYFKYEVFVRFGASSARKKSLSRIVSQNTFDYIHALEIQGAGYLLTQFSKSQLGRSKVILTNWGSDIYYFKELPEHLELIKKSLAIADFYSAECLRDYMLARELGFRGRELPCIPNAGGFNLNQLSTPLSKASTRSQIMIKGYGGRFGRAEIPISLIPKIDEQFPEFTYLIYSATEDIVSMVESLPPTIQKKIRLSSVRERISREEFLKEFAKSRIYIGCSNSDGISTSFLEALVHGAYPIQTNTSCADEWVQKGFIATLVGLNANQLFEAVQEALSDNNLVDLAAIQNTNLSVRHLEYKFLQAQALTFYESPALS